MQGRVVGNLVSTLNGLQQGHGDVGQVTVGDNCQGSSVLNVLAANGGQVRCGDALKVIAIESERSIDSSQGRDAKGRDISEGHVRSSLQVGELDI